MSASGPSSTRRSRSGSPGALISECATSTRKPSAPRSSQNFRIDRNSVADLRVLPVPVRLLGVEQVQVPLAGGAVGVGGPGPGRAAEAGHPVVRRQLAVLAAAVAEDVARPLGGAGRGGQRGLEPDVLVGGVVGHQVDDHLQAQLVGPLQQRVEVGQRPEDRVDVAVVGDVVAGVGLRGLVERRQPDGVDAELGQRAQPAGDAGQVADAVAVGVRERARIDLVDHRRAAPVVARVGGRPLGFASAVSGSARCAVMSLKRSMVVVSSMDISKTPSCVVWSDGRELRRPGFPRVAVGRGFDALGSELVGPGRQTVAQVTRIDSRQRAQLYKSPHRRRQAVSATTAAGGRRWSSPEAAAVTRERPMSPRARTTPVAASGAERG